MWRKLLSIGEFLILKKKKKQQDKFTFLGGLRIPEGNGINSDICA